MEIVKFIYLNQEVEFEIRKTNVMVNATEMSKCFPNKRLNDFIDSKDTQNFINECLKYSKNKIGNPIIEQNKLNVNNGNFRFISDYLNIETKEDLLQSKQKSGTWMHRILALKFASWLDTSFELWTYLTIDKLINISKNKKKP